jgi:hypothetical protein
MTDQANTPPVGETPSPEGDGGQKGGEEGGKRTVSYDTHRQLLDEKKKVQAELDRLLEEKKSREQKELEEKGEYKKLLEQERQAREAAEGKLKTFDEQEKGRRKMAAILSAAGGTIEDKWFDLVANTALDLVAIDPDTGAVDKMSVTKAVEKLKTSYPEIIKGTGGPGLPNKHPGAAGGTPGTILRSEWEKLPTSAEMKKWKPSQIVEG